MKKIILIIFFVFLYYVGSQQNIKIKEGYLFKNSLYVIEYKCFEKFSSGIDKYLGYTYLWGGDSLKTGIDCSGFTRLIYKNEFDTLIPRTTKLLLNFGEEVDYEDIENFDLMLFKNKSMSKVGHVGLYFDGNLLHASTKGTMLDTISDDNVRWKNYFKKRLIKVNRVGVY